MIYKLSKFVSMFFLTTLSPVVAFAQFVGPCPSGTYNNGSGCVGLSGLGGVLSKIQDLLGSILPIIVSLGVLYFIWGMVQYFIADGEEAKNSGKDRIIYGIIGLAVIVSIWGLVNLLVVTFDVGGVNAPSLDPVAASGTCTIGINPKLQNYLSYATCVINSSIIPLIFSLAVVMFVWGMVKFFIINADEEAKRTQGKEFMIWGIVALAVMISVWGLVNILGITFGIDGSILPQVCPPGGCR